MSYNFDYFAKTSLYISSEAKKSLWFAADDFILNSQARALIVAQFCWANGTLCFVVMVMNIKPRSQLSACVQQTVWTCKFMDESTLIAFIKVQVLAREIKSKRATM